jgi:hypothetical protein
MKNYILLVAAYNSHEQGELYRMNTYKILLHNRVMRLSPAVRKQHEIVLFDIPCGKVWRFDSSSKQTTFPWGNKNMSGEADAYPPWILCDEFYQALNKKTSDFSRLKMEFYTNQGLAFNYYAVGEQQKTEMLKVMSATDIYKFIIHIGANPDKCGKISELLIFGHGYPNGPILANSVDEQKVEKRDPSDKDCRYKDFNSANMSPEDLASFRKAFAPDGFIWIGGCNASWGWRENLLPPIIYDELTAYDGVNRENVDVPSKSKASAKCPNSHASQWHDPKIARANKLKDDFIITFTLFCEHLCKEKKRYPYFFEKAGEFKSIEDDGADAFFAWRSEQLGKRTDLYEDPRTEKLVANVDVEMRNVKKFFRNALARTYASAIASAAGVTCYGALPTTWTEYGQAHGDNPNPLLICMNADSMLAFFLKMAGIDSKRLGPPIHRLQFRKFFGYSPSMMEEFPYSLPDVIN